MFPRGLTLPNPTITEHLTLLVWSYKRAHTFPGRRASSKQETQSAGGAAFKETALLPVREAVGSCV